MTTTIQDGLRVQLDYALTVDGAVIDSSTAGKPFDYVHGRGQMISGLERQLTGLRVGDRREVTVSADEGYGPMDSEAFIEVPKEELSPDVTLEVGTRLVGTNPDGRPSRATIHTIGEDTVTLNLNHPLAGKTLYFKIQVVEITPAP